MNVKRVDIEVDLSDKDIDSMILLGASTITAAQFRHRIMSAAQNSGIKIPKQQVKINISCAQSKYNQFEAAAFIGILMAFGKLKPLIPLKDSLILGELGFDGSLKKLPRVFPIACEAAKLGYKRMYIPMENVRECSIIDNIHVIGVPAINYLIDLLKSPDAKMSVFEKLPEESIVSTIDYKDIKGQVMAKRAMQICAAGGHNILLYGPPGSGKSMMAKRLPTILNKMTHEQAIEVMRIYSMHSKIKSYSYTKTRPYRDPHHTISRPGLLGGGTGYISPGEISLAHNGVLFLDELTEFKPDVIEMLRQPLEDGYINLTRNHESHKIPADFQLVAAMNPCPCGYVGDKKRACKCSPVQIKNYLNKLSGPFIDRIDMQVFMHPVDYEDTHKTKPLSSAQLYEDVELAIKIQQKRFGSQKRNVHMNSAEIDTYCKLDSESSALLKKAFETLKLSMRSYHKILRISRTIADLEGESSIKQSHLKEAFSFRSFDKFVENYK